MDGSITITHATASANILAACDAGTLVQGQWHGRDKDGREIACLLGAMHPSVKSPADCNGDLMPIWLATMVPVLFDGLPAEAIIPMARRFGAAVAACFPLLSPRQWDAILTRVLIRCIDDAVEYARPCSEGKPYWPAVEAACKQVRDALNGGGNIKEAAAAAGTVWAAARAAGGWAASAAASAAAGAVWAAAGSAAGSAAGAVWAAARAAGEAREARAYESLFKFVLDQIEGEIAGAIRGRQ